MASYYYPGQVPCTPVNWSYNSIYTPSAPALSTYSAPPSLYPSYPPSAPSIAPISTRSSKSRKSTVQPVILPPNPMATGTPVMMPGVLNSTFTPTIGVLPFSGYQEVEASDTSGESDSESPIVPTLVLTPPPSPLMYSRSRSMSRHSYAQSRPRSHSGSRATSHHARSAAHSHHYEDHHHHHHHRHDGYSVRESHHSCSSAASSCSGSSHRSSHRARSTSSYRSRRARSPSREEYYPTDIYETRSVPEPPAALPAPVPTVKRHRSYFLPRRHPKPFTVDDWAAKAATTGPISQAQAKHFYPNGVELHPLLDKDTTSLFFSVLDSKKYVTLKDGSSIVPLEAHHATSPPLIKMEIINWHHEMPMVLENPDGIKLGEVIDAILRAARATIPDSEVREWSAERRGIIYHWHWYHRSRVAGMRKYLTVGDALGGYTAFEGLVTSQKAKTVDRKARGLSHCSMVLSLGKDGNIPGLRPLSDFPR